MKIIHLTTYKSQSAIAFVVNSIETIQPLLDGEDSVKVVGTSITTTSSSKYWVQEKMEDVLRLIEEKPKFGL